MRDIAHLEATREGLRMLPFRNPFSENVERKYSGVTFFDFVRYLLQLNTLLSWRFVVEESFKFGVCYVGTNPPCAGWGKGWTQDRWAEMSQADDGIYIDLNPSLDRKKVAKAIQDKFGIDIDPGEVYYWIFFHEVGHGLSAMTKQYFKKYWKLNCLPLTTRRASQEELLKAEKAGGQMVEIRKAAEQEAIEFARKRFLEWRKKAKDQREKSSIGRRPCLIQRRGL